MIDRTRNNVSKTSVHEWEKDRIRIGAVSYLNSKPLVSQLTRLAPAAEMVLDVPSHLADQLASSDLDVALIPSVEAFLDPHYEVVSNACVATHGPVLSVKLYSRVHPGEIKSLALDEGSRTSAALARLMLAERFGVDPQLEQLPLQSTTTDTEADAVLLIGDRAISPPEERFHTVFDLGEEWVRWTGLPFVFAMWVTRTDVELNGVGHALASARDLGLQHIRDIAAEGARELGLSKETALNYLTKNLHFHLGEAEKAGLKLFQELAAANGLAPSKSLRFRDLGKDATGDGKHDASPVLATSVSP